MSLAARLVVIGALICGAAGAAIVALAQPAPLPEALAAAPTLPPRATDAPTATPAPGQRLRVQPLLPSPEPSATVAPSATAQPSPTASPTQLPSATRIPQVAIASFALSASDMRYNIEVALNANGGALRRVLIAPGETFSFNAALGPRPTRLPWRLVGRQPTPTQAPRAAARYTAFQTEDPTPTAAPLDSPFAIGTAAPADTAAPAEPTAEQAAPTAPAEPPAAPEPSATSPAAEPVRVLGGGVCDLASRYVVAGRKLLPARAFRFREHPGGVAGVKRSDAVSIWATDGGRYDNDLLITNTSAYYLVFEAHIDREIVTVLAWFQEGP